ncbi:hypothetical protein RYO59_001821 [Thermosynechococcaceae cyanobacterium Okahandja]
MSQAWVYLGAIALLAILVVQNWQPVLPLRFLGQQTPPLPLALWIAAAAMVGILWGRILLFLSGSPAAEPRRPQRRRSPEPTVATEDPSMRPPPEDTDPVADVEDWFEESEPPPPEPVIQDSPPRRSSSYSYQYRPSRKSSSAAPPPPSVVDADYRILTPPPPSDRPEDDADWDINL